MRSLSLFLSYLFMPLLMPTLVFLFLGFAAPQLTNLSTQNKLFVLGMVFATTFLIPLTSLLTMKLTRVIGSFQMHSREERALPFSAISLFYILSTYLFHLKLETDAVFVLALATISVCVVILTAITFFWKISAHMTGMAGLLAIVLAISIKFPASDMLPFILSCMVATGCLASARLYLDAHRPDEVWGGFAVGFLVCFLSFFYLL